MFNVAQDLEDGFIDSAAWHIEAGWDVEKATVADADSDAEYYEKKYEGRCQVCGVVFDECECDKSKHVDYSTDDDLPF